LRGGLEDLWDFRSDMMLVIWAIKSSVFLFLVVDDKAGEGLVFPVSISAWSSSSDDS
jgi:hypothetical protein